MPEFYDWTGADQSRPAPVIPWIAGGLVLGALVAIALLAWAHLQRSKTPSASSSDGRASYRLLHILALMTAVALFIASGRWGSFFIATCVLQGIVYLTVLILSAGSSRYRFPTLFMFVVQVAPFAWTLRKSAALQNGPIVYFFLVGFPSIFPLGFLVHPNHQSNFWIFMLASTLEFALGVWIGSRGRKRMLAYGLLVLTCSLFGSFLLHALLRM